jgi:rubrerythrin
MFNADEIFEMAERIEANGAAFYRKAAQMQKDRKASDFLLNLAVMEDGHLQTFVQMRRELSEREREVTAYDPDGVAALYLDAMADGHGGDGDPFAAATLTGRETLGDILTLAIGLEKKSVLFYLGLRDMVPPKLGGKRIEKIIEEEKSHIAALFRERRALRGA